MPSCEKCWSDAFLRTINDPSKSQIEHYMDLLKERDTKPCSAKEHAGEYWDEKKQCDSREENS